MTPEEFDSLTEALDLIKTTANALALDSPLHEAFVQVEMIKHKNIALQLICTRHIDNPIDIAKQSFGIGYYLGLQYAKLEKMERSL